MNARLNPIADAIYEQGSPEWYAARCGRINGSRFNDVLGTKHQRARYARELAFERLSGNPMHEVGSRSMTWGTEVEPFHREAFELATGLICRKAPFLTHPRYPFIGVSPDSVIDPDSGLEMKSPHSEDVHVLTWLEGMPDEHIAQVQGGMFVTGAACWWFSSYDPRQAPPYRLYYQRIERDPAYIAYLSGSLLEFNKEVDAIVESIKEKAGATK